MTFPGIFLSSFVCIRLYFAWLQRTSPPRSFCTRPGSSSSIAHTPPLVRLPNLPRLTVSAGFLIPLSGYGLLLLPPRRLVWHGRTGRCSFSFIYLFFLDCAAATLLRHTRPLLAPPSLHVLRILPVGTNVFFCCVAVRLSPTISFCVLSVLHFQANR